MKKKISGMKNDIGGVWRTIGGRPVFIKTGQSVSDAMKESGKFKKAEKGSSGSSSEYKKQIESENKTLKDTLKYKKEVLEEEMNSAYEKYREHTKKHDYNNEKWREENTKLLDEAYKKREEFQNTFEDYVKHTDEKDLSWQDKTRVNDLEGAKKRAVLEGKRGKGEYEFHRDKWNDEYYETYREAERKNAKIKAENEKPDDDYVNIPAYAGYKDKFDQTWGEDGMGTKTVSAKMYTNDEFMEHLEDANWHTEREKIIDAKLTNKQLEYVKENTKVSAWGADLDKGKTEKLIKEAREKYPKGSATKNTSGVQRNPHYDQYKDMFNMYKKIHPNTEMSVMDFIKMMEKMK